MRKSANAMQAAPDAMAATTTAFDFAKIPKAKNRATAQKDQNDDQARTDGPPGDLEGHQEPRLRDLIGEGAGGRESLLLLVGRRREGAEKGFYGPPGRERNGYGEAFRIRRLGAPEGVVGTFHRCFQSIARDSPVGPQSPSVWSSSSTCAASASSSVFCVVWKAKLVPTSVPRTSERRRLKTPEIWPMTTRAPSLFCSSGRRR